MNLEHRAALNRVKIIQWKIYELDPRRRFDITNEIVRFLVEAWDHNRHITEDVLLWHKLAGSTPRNKSMLDYDSPWSILEFMNKLAKREGFNIEE